MSISGKPMPAEEVERIMQNFDKDGNQVIDFDEFVSGMGPWFVGTGEVFKSKISQQKQEDFEEEEEEETPKFKGKNKKSGTVVIKDIPQEEEPKLTPEQLQTMRRIFDVKLQYPF
jgi:Ca2+-binding EF-hand superfamily protein